MALFRYPLPEPDWTVSVSSGSPVPVSEMLRWMFLHGSPRDISGTQFAPVQNAHISYSSPCNTVRLDCFALHVSFPRSLVRHDSHDYYQSSVASTRVFRQSRVSSR
jgi:hypothetical protein